MKIFNKKEISEHGVIIPENTEGLLIYNSNIALDCERTYVVYFNLHNISLNKGVCENPYGETKHLKGHVYLVKSKDFALDITHDIENYKYEKVWERQLKKIFKTIPEEFYNLNKNTYLKPIYQTNIFKLISYLEDKISKFENENKEFYELTEDNIEEYVSMFSNEVEIGDNVYTDSFCHTMRSINDYWNGKLSEIGVYYDFLRWDD